MDSVLAFSLLLFFGAVLFGALIVMGKLPYFQRRKGEDEYSWWSPVFWTLFWIINAVLIASLFESWLAKTGIFLLCAGIPIGNEIFRYKSFKRQHQAVKETK